MQICIKNLYDDKIEIVFDVFILLFPVAKVADIPLFFLALSTDLPWILPAMEAEEVDKW